MNHYETNGTYRRKTSNKLNEATRPQFQIIDHQQGNEEAITTNDDTSPSLGKQRMQSSRSSLAGKKTPVVLSRSILLNGQATTSKQTSFQYVPAVINPAVSALQKATKNIDNKQST